MAYIGKQPTVGNFVKLDAITTSATATYNLLNGGVAYSPQSANHCIVSLNGVIQSPNTSFTISGSTIVFASALTATDVIDFILVLGDVLNIGTPSDGTVTNAKLALTAGSASTPTISPTSDTNTGIFFPAADTIGFAEGGTEAMRINSSGIVTKPLHPAFRAKITSAVLNVTGDNTVYSLATSIWSEIYDQGSNFNPTTGTFTAPVTGKYTFTCNLTLTGIDATAHSSAQFDLVASNRDTTFYASPEDYYNSSLGGASYTLTTDVDMDASDTFFVSIVIGTGSKTIDIWTTTTLTGHLIC